MGERIGGEPPVVARPGVAERAGGAGDGKAVDRGDEHHREQAQHELLQGVVDQARTTPDGV